MMNLLLSLVFWIIGHMQIQAIHAPELIRGEMLSIVSPLHVGYINGGDWQAVMIGRRIDAAESGYIFRASGAQIDNNNAPVHYEVIWRNSHKYIGTIDFRGHPRKLCTASTKGQLPCE